MTIRSRKSQSFEFAFEVLAQHFAGLTTEQLVSSSRQFPVPGHMRADLQLALTPLFGETVMRFFGLHI
jgi:hypothetical protein